jgi:DNA helicase-2/ATP-dependent DNA helicase PcrA
MATITGDVGWLEPEKGVKTLILEHRMAANRLGFLPLWDALSGVDRLQTGLRDGSLPGLRFFSHLILPLTTAYQGGNDFAVASIVRTHSPLLQKDTFQTSGNDQKSQIRKAREAVNFLAGLWSEGKTPTFLQVLRMVHETSLFQMPEIFRPFAKNTEEPTEEVEEPEDNKNDELVAWRAFLDTSFEQIAHYSNYIQGEAQYDTHQGIKGLEFPRVCVVMDDSEARGFMFSYEKLFEAKEDSTKRDPGQETSIDRTRRLFYVTCSRAEDSLALIAYSSNPEQVRHYVVREAWFKEEEIDLMA